MQKVLITGISGFVGRHLVSFIQQQRSNCQIFGLARNLNEGQQLINKEIRFFKADITDFVKLRKIILALQPDKIFHLAAQVSVPRAWQNPQETFEINVFGALNLLESIRALNKKPAILIAGSSSEYGNIIKDDLPIKETMILRPVDPYGVSKASQSLLVYQYSQIQGMKIIYTRAFNHTGPGQAELGIVGRFAKEIAEIEIGRREPLIKVGNLQAKRDFLDVRDVVRAYWLALRKGEAGEVYNICADRAYSIKEILAGLIGLSRAKIKIEKDLTLFRRSDIPVSYGSSGKFRRLTGWRPKYNFLQQTLPDLLNWWRINLTKN